MNSKTHPQEGDQEGELRESLAEQFTSLGAPHPLTRLAQQFTMSTFSGTTPDQLAQQFTLSIFRTK